MTHGKVFEKFLTEAEERQLVTRIRACSGWIARRDLQMVHLMRATGCRIGTLCGLTVEDATRALTTDGLYFRPEICKGRRGYTAEVTNRVRLALRVLLAIRRRLRIGLDPAAPLVVSRVQGGNRGGEWMSARQVQRRVEYWAAQAGLRVKCTPHWFRHTFAQRLMDNSTADPMKKLLIVADRLNHADLNTTRIYTRPTRADVSLALREAGS